MGLTSAKTAEDPLSWSLPCYRSRMSALPTRAEVRPARVREQYALAVGNREKSRHFKFRCRGINPWLFCSKGLDGLTTWGMMEPQKTRKLCLLVGYSMFGSDWLGRPT